MSQSVFPILRAHDPRALIAWIEAALGGTLLALHEGPEGTVGHAEVRVGEGIVMLGEASDDGLSKPPGSFAVYVAVDDVDAVHRAAVEADAEVVREPFDTDYGSRDAAFRDPEGNVWSFGTYRPED
jgi:uncharacterized glyoxalase superfamily protein PhnB